MIAIWPTDKPRLLTVVSSDHRLAWSSIALPLPAGTGVRDRHPRGLNRATRRFALLSYPIRPHSFTLYNASIYVTGCRRSLADQEDEAVYGRFEVEEVNGAE